MRRVHDDAPLRSLRMVRRMGDGVSDVIDPADLDPDATLVIVNALAMPGFPPPVPGAELRPCVVCGRDTWAAPSSIAAEKVRRTVHACRRDGGAIAIATADDPDRIDVFRLPGAAADVAAPGSVVTEEGERHAAEQLREGR